MFSMSVPIASPGKILTRLARAGSLAWPWVGVGVGVAGFLSEQPSCSGLAGLLPRDWLSFPQSSF